MITNFAILIMFYFSLPYQFNIFSKIDLSSGFTHVLQAMHPYMPNFNYTRD